MMRGPTMRRPLFIAFVLAFVGGYADAASYLLTKSFTGHITGNTVLLCLHLGQGSWREALSNVAAITAFLAGTAAAEWMEASSGAPEQSRQLSAPLLVEGGLFLIATACRWQTGALANDLTVVCLCLALGSQNGALRKCGSMSVHTTFITGLGTSLMTATLKRASGAEKPNEQQAHPPAALAGILLAFAAGAFAGGWLDDHFKVWGLAAIFVPWLAALAAAQHD